jgi:hypothetical protein
VTIVQKGFFIEMNPVQVQLFVPELKVPKGDLIPTSRMRLNYPQLFFLKQAGRGGGYYSAFPIKNTIS